MCSDRVYGRVCGREIHSAFIDFLKAFEENLSVLQVLFYVLRIITLVCLFVKRFGG
jgi:hypothetical protein